jgi:hypothetical protein
MFSVRIFLGLSYFILCSAKNCCAPASTTITAPSMRKLCSMRVPFLESLQDASILSLCMNCSRSEVLSEISSLTPTLSETERIMLIEGLMILDPEDDGFMINDSLDFVTFIKQNGEISAQNVESTNTDVEAANYIESAGYDVEGAQRMDERRHHNNHCKRTCTSRSSCSVRVRGQCRGANVCCARPVRCEGVCSRTRCSGRSISGQGHCNSGFCCIHRKTM